MRQFSYIMINKCIRINIYKILKIPTLGQALETYIPAIALQRGWKVYMFL